VTLRLWGRSLTIGRLETTRGDGLSWWRYGVWFRGAGPGVPVGSQREVSLEWNAGARGRTRQKTLDAEGHFR